MQRSMPLPTETVPAPAAAPAFARRRRFAGGTKGNERLTALNGTVLIALLAVIGVTILSLRTLLWVHLFIGMVLLGPVALKLGTTLYRFARYYTHDAAYRAEGPPETALRLMGPIVVITTIIVFVSGVALLFAGPSSRSTLLPIHKVSFIVWVAFTAVHVLAHLPALPRAVRGDWGPRRELIGPRLAGREARSLALGGAIVAGLVLALLVLGEFTAWTHWNAVPHGHGH
jgi:hypothetical protein